LVRSAAAGVGNKIVLFGALTGRDGIGGASVLASAELGDEDEAKRPTVQIGDPFEEKRLLECSLELLDAGLLRSLQDLGAAGLTSSASEMASKGEVGIDIDVSRVPLREEDMEPFEIMVSESQERMLCVVEPEKLDAVLELCAKWEVRATAIGEVTDSRHMRVLADDEVVGDIPVEALVDDCPVYDLEPEPPREPIYPAPPRRLDSRDTTAATTLLELLRAPTVASKRWAYEQYDTLVGSRTVRRAGAGDAAVLQLAPDGGRGAIATAIDGNGRRVAADPYTGAAEAVLECAQNLACVGAEPLGTTNCLNFGNPEKPHIAWQLTEAVRGIGDACRALDAPIVGGNVSLYNEGSEGPIYPTPIVGMVGWLPDPEAVPGMGFREAGHEIALVGPFDPNGAGSELEKLTGGLATELPAIDLREHARGLALVREAVREGLVASAHDVSDGGLAVALAECCIAGGVGARVELPHRGFAPLFFGEGPGGFVVSGDPAAIEELERRAGDVGFRRLGAVGGESLEVFQTGFAQAAADVASAGIEGFRSDLGEAEDRAREWLAAAAATATLRIPVAELAAAWESSIPAKFS
jgi:phosphoribosylformylglycinamidine synthase